jgi:peptidoglycan/xylan/chitin deacetylase (PgdA/CDA1 family)
MTILCFHSVDPAWRSPLAVTPSAFDAHCRWLGRVGRVAPLDVAITDRSSRSIAVTFDDGFSGVHEHALPILMRHGIPATVFVVAGTLREAGMPAHWVDTPPAWPLSTLTLSQLLEMQEAGVRIESHGYAHVDLTRLTEAEIRHDLRSSKELLEDLLRRPIRFLAYPLGRHDGRVRLAARSVGFTHAFGLPERREAFGSLAIPRVGVYPGNGVAALRLKTSRWYLGVRTSAAYPSIRTALRGRPSPAGLRA